MVRMLCATLSHMTKLLIPHRYYQGVEQDKFGKGMVVFPAVGLLLGAFSGVIYLLLVPDAARRWLNMRIKPKKRLKRDKPEPLTVPESSNECWSMDFMHDQLSDGCSVRLLNVIDDYQQAG